MTATASGATVRVVGRIASLRVMDVSKRAGVERLKSYVKLEVDHTEPDGIAERIAGRELVHDGALDLEVGTPVEVETHLDHAGIGPLPIYRIVINRPEMT